MEKCHNKGRNRQSLLLPKVAAGQSFEIPVFRHQDSQSLQPKLQDATTHSVLSPEKGLGGHFHTPIETGDPGVSLAQGSLGMAKQRRYRLFGTGPTLPGESTSFLPSSGKNQREAPRLYKAATRCPDSLITDFFWQLALPCWLQTSDKDLCFSLFLSGFRKGLPTAGSPLF